MKRKITISESQIINAIKKVINEARRNPETNIDESFAEFYNRMIQKAPRENIFVSFREEIHVTDINPKNRFNTPTGFYSYPLSSFDIYDNPSEIEFRRSFPFGNKREYINFFILKNHDGVLTDKTDKSTLNGYVRRIKKLYPNSSKVKELCDSFIGGRYTSDYINEDPDRKVHHMTHLFWLFLYNIAQAARARNIQNKINTICREIGVNGFVDYEGHEYIHSAEPSQAVFFKVKNLGEIFIYEKPKTANKDFKNAIQNKEYKILRDVTDSISVISLFGNYGLINKKSGLIFKQWFDYIGYLEDGVSRVGKNGRWNFINQNGELISKLWFDDVGYFENGVSRVKMKDRWNLINQNGELISKQWFDKIHWIKGGLATIELDGKYNFIGQSGELISSKQWFDWVDNFKDGFARVEINDKWNLVKQSGGLVSKRWFDWIDYFKGGVVRVQSKGKHNFINEKGELLSNQWFDNVSYFGDETYIIKLNNKWNIINQNIKLLSPNQWFDGIYFVGGILGPVELNGKWNFINQSGKLLSPNQWFEWAGDFKGSFGKVKLNNKEYRIDLNNGTLNEVD